MSASTESSPTVDYCEPDREMQRRGRIRYATREEARAARLETYRKYDLKRGRARR